LLLGIYIVGGGSALLILFLGIRVHR